MVKVAIKLKRVPVPINPSNRKVLALGTLAK